MMSSSNQKNVWALSLLLLCLWPASGQSSVDRTADQILGRWQFPGRGSTIDVYRTGDRYYGRIAEVSPTGLKQFGLAKDQLLIINLAYDGKGWSGGELIHPKTGNHLDVEISLRDSKTASAIVYKGWRWLHKEYVLTRHPTS
jgi:uncharacterized protein (DUF2147 family)